MQSRLKQGKGHITDTISKKMDKKPVIVPMPSPSYSTSTTDCYINLKKDAGQFMRICIDKGNLHTNRSKGVCSPYSLYRIIRI